MVFLYSSNKWQRSCTLNNGQRSRERQWKEYTSGSSLSAGRAGKIKAMMMEWKEKPAVVCMYVKSGAEKSNCQVWEIQRQEQDVDGWLVSGEAKERWCRKQLGNEVVHDGKGKMRRMVGWSQRTNGMHVFWLKPTVPLLPKNTKKPFSTKRETKQKNKQPPPDFFRTDGPTLTHNRVTTKTGGKGKGGNVDHVCLYFCFVVVR